MIPLIVILIVIMLAFTPGSSSKNPGRDMFFMAVILMGVVALMAHYR